jgi:hypothetical protein
VTYPHFTTPRLKIRGSENSSFRTQNLTTENFSTEELATDVFVTENLTAEKFTYATFKYIKEKCKNRHVIGYKSERRISLATFKLK